MFKKKDFLPYEEARRWASRLRLSNYKQWLKYVKEHDIPEGIPKNPQVTYGDDYISDGDFLGNRHWQYLPYYQAKYFARSLDLKTYSAWLDWHKAHGPNDIPRYPDQVYEEWETWGEFLGTGTIWTNIRTYRSYNEALKWVHAQRFKTQEEWMDFCKNQSDKLPADIPTRPDIVYEEFTVWATWLGNKVIERLEVQKIDTSIIYVIREHGAAANMLTFGIESGGKGALTDKQRVRQFQIIRTYKNANPADFDRIKFALSRQGHQWLGPNHQYIVANLHQLIYELDNLLEKV